MKPATMTWNNLPQTRSHLLAIKSIPKMSTARSYQHTWRRYECARCKREIETPCPVELIARNHDGNTNEPNSKNHYNGARNDLQKRKLSFISHLRSKLLLCLLHVRKLRKCPCDVLNVAQEPIPWKSMNYYSRKLRAQQTPVYTSRVEPSVDLPEPWLEIY